MKKDGSSAIFKRQNPESALVYTARTRSRLFGLPCTITAKDVVIPKLCPILGIVLRNTRVHSPGKRFPVPNSPSIDRIVPSKGYVPGNIRVISHRANRMRGDFSLREIERLYLYLMKEGEH